MVIEKAAALEERIAASVSGFNRYRKPEAEAILMSLQGRSLKIAFSGPFCRTCGFYDYFDDFVIEAERKGLALEISGISEKQEGAEVVFSIMEA